MVQNAGEAAAQQAITTPSGTSEGPLDQPDGFREQPVRNATGAGPLVLTAPRELEYVFEVSAEEASPQGLPDSEEVADEFVLDEDDLARAETVEDESFAYEVRNGPQTGGRGANTGENAFSKINSRRRSRKRKEK